MVLHSQSNVLDNQTHHSCVNSVGMFLVDDSNTCSVEENDV